MPEHVFDLYSNYYDLLYKDKNYLQETDYIKKILDHHNILSGNILEFGSGTGKHGTLLSNYGYDVHGIELSEKMVEIAKLSKVNGFSCQQGDITSIKMNKTYDVVLALFHVISYQTTNYKLDKVFSNASEHLNTGGIFVFDFWYSPAVYSQRPSARIKHMENDNFEVTRFAEPKIYNNENRVDVEYTIFIRDIKTGHIETFKEVHPMRHFSLLELDIVAEKNSFNRVQSEEFLTGKSASENTWGVCTTFRKI